MVPDGGGGGGGGGDGGDRSDSGRVRIRTRPKTVVFFNVLIYLPVQFNIITSRTKILLFFFCKYF